MPKVRRAAVRMPRGPRRANERRPRRPRVLVRRSTRSSASNRARPGRFRACAARPSGPLFRERREKKPRPSREMVSGGSATARRVARDVPRDARRDRFPAPALTPLVPDLAETRRRPIQEPHPRGAQRQLPLAHQRRREEGTDETLRGRSTVALPRSAISARFQPAKFAVDGCQLPSVNFLRGVFTGVGFHRRGFSSGAFSRLRPNDDADRTFFFPKPNLMNRARRTRETRTKKRMNFAVDSSGCA